MDQVTFILDGKTVSADRGRCIMDIASENGIFIPGLCYHPGVKSSGGSCRLCLVEVHQNGRMQTVTACNYPVRSDIEVKTDTEFIRRLRSTIAQLLLPRVPDSTLLKELVLSGGKAELHMFSGSGSNEIEKCISCGLCVQVCEDVVGVSAISMINRGVEKQPGTPFGKASESCIGCAACSYACPTGALSQENNGDVRKIWGRDFKLHRCKKCNTPYIAEAQIDFICMKTGKDRAFFDLCPDCR